MPFVLTSVVVFELCVTPLVRIRGSEQKFVDLLTYKKWVPMLVLSSSSLTYIRVRSEATEAVSQLLQRRKKWFTSKWLTCLAWLKACWPIGNLHLNSMQKPICLIEIIDDNNSKSLVAMRWTTLCSSDFADLLTVWAQQTLRRHNTWWY